MTENILGFIFLAALLIVINELREWRLSNKMNEFEDKFDDFMEICSIRNNEYELNFRKIISSLHELCDNDKSIVSAIKTDHDNIDIFLNGLNENSVENKKFAEKAAVDLSTIVNEYKINGIPLGLQRKPHVDPYDMIEGL